MTNLIKIGDKYLNVSMIQSVVDQFQANRVDELTVRFGADDHRESFTFKGQEADNLRTWLNSNVNDLTHLHLDSDAG